MEITVHSESELNTFGKKLGATLAGGESLELVGDVGAGKTTLTKAIAAGMGIDDTISSPSYTLSQTYKAPNGLRLVHYDFYRLDDPGILANELEEVLAEKRSVVVIEWAGIVADVLPVDHLSIHITPTGETSRQLQLKGEGDQSRHVLGQLQ